MTDHCKTILDYLNTVALNGSDALRASLPTALAALRELQAQQVGINGLTEAETSASMSVMGLSKPTVQPAQQAQKPVLPEQIEDAWRAGWAACRDAEYVGEEAENESWGMSQTCANADWENAGQQAQKPVARTCEQELIFMNGAGDEFRSATMWPVDRTTYDILLYTGPQRELVQQVRDALEYANTGNRRPEIIGPAIAACDKWLEANP